jgi:endonuclease YncB( thermonuclease family)
MVVVTAAALAACLLPATATPDWSAASVVQPARSTAVSWSTARVLRWVDGDTVRTSRGVVRVIGVDTPEVGRCGSKKATRLAKRVAPVGSLVRLGNPRSVDNRDRYGRSLRYVQRGRADVAAQQIKAGSKARYDSRDGYDRHPREARYRTLDRAHADYRCTGRTPAQPDRRSYPPATRWDCPRRAPIKGNASSMIYHMPGQAYYHLTTPEECFASEAGAWAAGYRKAKV